ncbi:BTAD domain-containing putative transcriptional regulator [Nocardiopsis sp. CNT312]|uniref:BTAD domain-containing putative transcriptional regulator n=1 Tax=Nocardiopsis sp. CNT312 TaxID=1137268 RepID=UPI0004AEC4D0|nr:BTAD domain-containing putative transcriptional regulator [Nocardiopsis sp. CNT312]
MAVWTDAGDQVTVPGRKVRALLACLLAAEGRPVPPERLVEEIWEERPPQRAGAALHAKVSQLRRVLGEAETGGRELVALRGAGYLLEAERGAVDARRFRDLVGTARERADAVSRVAALTEALSLWRGPAYADFAHEPALRAVAARLDEERVEALEARAEASVDAGECTRIIGELEELVRQHPLRERLRAAQMRALHHAGRRSEALDSYSRLRTLLTEELGLEPGEGVRRLQAQILRGELPQTPSSHTALSVPSARRSIPRGLTRIVGREEAVADVRCLLDRHRLVTLTGPGGVGKTRVALEVGAGEQDSGLEVVLVELASLAPAPGPDEVPRLAAEMARALDLRVGPGPTTAEEAVSVALGGREVLLVIDNCEHVVEALAPLVESLLARSEGLRVLTTGREPLAVAGERRYEVRPLELPPRQGAIGAEGARRSTAVMLFVERASAACHGFTLDDSNAADVVTLCRRLDGLPLALELAAPRVCSLGVGEVLERLDDSFRLLDGGRRAASPRQRTLRAVTDWSWHLLAEGERAVLRRLAVFADGCDLSSAESVCSGGGVAPDEVAGILARLVDRSLVASAAHGRSEPRARRFRLLETIAAYAGERLYDAGERDGVGQRHLDRYTELASRCAKLLRGREQGSALMRLDTESANTRVALERALRAKETEGAWSLAASLTWYWLFRGRLSEGRALLDELVAQGGSLTQRTRNDAEGWWAGLALLDGAGLDTDGRVGRVVERFRDGAAECSASTRWFLAHALLNTGDAGAGRPVAERALEDARCAGDRWTEAAALCVLAGQAQARGDLEALHRDATRARTLFTGIGDGWGMIQASFALASWAEVVGDYDQARDLHRESVRRARELRMWPEEADAVTGLARIGVLVGDFAEARSHHERAVRLAVDSGYKVGELFARIGLGLGARREGRLEEAQEHLTGVLETNRRSEVDTDVVDGLLLTELGLVAELRGRHDDALRLQAEGYAVARRLGDPRALALSLEGLASATAAVGRHAVSARLLGTAYATRESVGAPLPEAERGDVRRVERLLREALGTEGFEAGFALGRRISAVEAFALAVPDPR